MKKKNRKLIAMTVITAFCGVLTMSCLTNKKVEKTNAVVNNYDIELTPTFTYTGNEYRPTEKANYRVEEDNMLIIGNWYLNRAQYTTLDTTAFRYTGVGSSSITDITNVTDTNAGMWIYQITPYATNIDTEVTINARVNWNLNSIPENYATTQNVMWTLTTQDDWSYLLNKQTISTFDELADIVNPANNYNYTQKTKSQNLGTTLSNNNYTIDITETVTISYTATTYILIYICPTIVSYDQTPFTNSLGCNGYGIDIKPQWAPQANPQGYTNHIRGTYIIAEGGTIEVVDVGGLLFQILTMPFSFISVAFNLTLFPNTPYQINFSNLFLTVLAVLIFVFIIRLLISAGSKAGGQ